MSVTIIKCKKDLYNLGLCFSKGSEYIVNQPLRSNASLMEVKITNDQGEPHIIGAWWKHFKIKGR